MTGVTPSRYEYPPGNIWRYGAAGDGVTDDTAAFTAMLASADRELMVENGVFSISGNRILAVDGIRLTTTNATLKVRDETGIEGGAGLLNVTANDCHLDIEIDHNSLGLTGVVLSGNANYAKIKSKNLVGSTSSAGYESAVLVVGHDSTICVEGYNLVQGSAPSGAVPRLVTCQGGGVGTTITMLKGRNVQDGLTVGAHSDITVACVDIEGCADNPFYLLAASRRLKVLGGRLKDVAEWAAIKGEDHEFCNLQVVDFSVSGTIEDATRIAFRGCRFIHLNSALTGAPIATRGSNAISSDITIENCQADVNVRLGGLAHFSTGTVNDFKVIGGYYNLSWRDSTSTSARIVTHNSGDSIIYKNVIIVLNDYKSSPMTSGNILYLDIPNVSTTSLYDNVQILNNTAATVRQGAKGGIAQPNLHVFSSANIAGGGLYLSSISSTARRMARSAASPTAGTWGAGDIVWNSAPVLESNNMLILGWICTVGGTPGTWQPMRVSTVNTAV